MSKDSLINTVLITALCGCILFILSAKQVPKNHIGIRSTFGKIKDGHLKEGFYLISPFEKLERFDLRQITSKNNISVAVQDKSKIELEVNIKFRFVEQMINQLAEISKSQHSATKDLLLRDVQAALYHNTRTIPKSTHLLEVEVCQVTKDAVLKELAPRLQAKGIILDDISISKGKLTKPITCQPNSHQIITPSNGQQSIPSASTRIRQRPILLSESLDHTRSCKSSNNIWSINLEEDPLNVGDLQ